MPTRMALVERDLADARETIKELEARDVRRNGQMMGILMMLLTATVMLVANLVVLTR